MSENCIPYSDTPLRSCRRQGEISEPSRRTHWRTKLRRRRIPTRTKSPFMVCWCRQPRTIVACLLPADGKTGQSLSTMGGTETLQGRWEPSDRGNHLSKEKGAFVDKMAIMLRKFVVEKYPTLRGQPIPWLLATWWSHLSKRRTWLDFEQIGSAFWRGQQFRGSHTPSAFLLLCLGGDSSKDG